MKRSILALSAAALLALAATPALAETFSGEIIELDRGSKSIEVRGGDSQRRVRFFLAPGGELTRGSLPVTFADLRRGDRVEIDFLRKGSTHTAYDVAVVAATPAAAVASE